MPDLLDAKYIIEFRYPAAAQFHDKRGSITSGFQDDRFAHWQINPVRIDLSSEDKRDTAFATSKNAGLNQEMPASKDEFIQHTRRFARLVFRDLDIRRLNRMGVRQHILLPQQSFDFAKELFARLDQPLELREVNVSIDKTALVEDPPGVFVGTSSDHKIFVIGGSGHIQVMGSPTVELNRADGDFTARFTGGTADMIASPTGKVRDHVHYSCQIDPLDAITFNVIPR